MIDKVNTEGERIGPFCGIVSPDRYVEVMLAHEIRYVEVTVSSASRTSDIFYIICCGPDNPWQILRAVKHPFALDLRHVDRFVVDLGPSRSSPNMIRVSTDRTGADIRVVSIEPVVITRGVAPMTRFDPPADPAVALADAILADWSRAPAEKRASVIKVSDSVRVVRDSGHQQWLVVSDERGILPDKFDALADESFDNLSAALRAALRLNVHAARVEDAALWPLSLPVDTTFARVWDIESAARYQFVGTALMGYSPGADAFFAIEAKCQKLPVPFLPQAVKAQDKDDLAKWRPPGSILRDVVQIVVITQPGAAGLLAAQELMAGIDPPRWHGFNFTEARATMRDAFRKAHAAGRIYIPCSGHSVEADEAAIISRSRGTIDALVGEMRPDATYSGLVAALAAFMFLDANVRARHYRT